jgi:outer membrane protein assembly factor BamB
MHLLLAAVLLASCGGKSTAPSLPAPQELRLLWSLPTPWAWLRTPACVDTSFYLMIEHGTLSQMNLLDGRVLREVSPQEPGDYERPVVDGSSLFLTCGNSNVCCFELAGLAPRWSSYVYPPDSVDCCGMHMEWELSPPVVDPSGVYFTSQDGNLYCLDRQSGAFRWKHRLGDVSVAAPLVRNGAVYAVGFDSCFSAIDVATGDLLWRIQLGEPVEFTELKAVGSFVYVAGRGGSVFSIDPASRSIRWRRKVGSLFRSQISASPQLICAADGQGIYGLDPMTGQTKWRRDIPGEGPTEAHGRIYSFASDRDILVLDLSTGATLAYYAVGEPGFFNQPVVVGNRILAAARGRIYCFADITD